tara:strand:+ start:1459 stop:2982 length:1524 start_codon:yes stop_codon:yes gene_type:complete
MPEEAHLKVSHIIQGAAESAVGGSGGETGKKSGIEEGTEKPEEKKKKKSMFGQISGIFTSVLGMQVTFAAMLRQSQIATGWLGAVFQVAGAILDSFLLAFAPALFRIIEVMTTFIPVAREAGERIASQIGDVWEMFKGWGTTVVTKLSGLWDWLAKVYDIFADHPILWKILAALYIFPKLMRFFQVPFLMKLMSGINRELRLHRIKSARASRGGGKGAGMMGMAMMMPQAQMLAVVMAMAPLVLGFMGMGKGKSSRDPGALDVTGQLGKEYAPSRASQLGGSLNEQMSAAVQPFSEMAEPAVSALVEQSNRAAEEMTQVAAVTKGMHMSFDEYGTGVAGMDAALHRNQETLGGTVLTTAEAITKHNARVEAAGATWVKGASQAKNQFVDTTGILMGSAEEMSDTTTNAIAKSFSEAAMGSMTGGLLAFDTNLAMLNQDFLDSNRVLTEGADATKDAAKALTDAAAASKAAAKSWSDGQDMDRAQQEEIRDASNMANDKMLSYLTSVY